MMMAIWKIAPALAAGNTVVLKPCDTTPETTLLLAEIAAEFLPAGRLQRHLRRPRHRPRCSSSTRPRRWSRSPARCGPACRSPRAPRTTSSGSTSSSAARRRSSSSTTPTSRPPSRASPSPATSTPARTAPRRPACSPAPRHPRRLRRRARRAGQAAGQGRHARRRRRAASARSTTPTSSATSPGFIDRLPDHAAVAAGGTAVGGWATATSSSRPSSPACTRTTR